MASSSTTTLTLTLTSISLSSPEYFLSKPNSSLALSLSPRRVAKYKQSLSLTVSPKKATPLWRTRATAAEAPPALEEAAKTQLEASKEIVSAVAGGDGVSTAISALLFVAFVGLSLLTVGVVYIGVTDFLRKREREKFEKEEEADRKKNKNKGKKKNKAKARAGPRGFGQKIDNDNLDDIDDD